MPISLEKLNSTPRSDTLNSVSVDQMPTVVNPGAGVANMVIQTAMVMPVQYKIRKVSIYFTAIDSIAGTDLFNLVVGTGAYSQNNPALNDNSFDTFLPGGVGYPTNVATVGQTVFPTDIALNATNVPNIATGTGGYVILIPPYYDAVYPAGVPLTLRMTTTASTGSVSGFTVALAVVPLRLRPAPVGSQVYGAIPGRDY